MQIVQSNKMNADLKYSAESGGYTVLLGGRFIGRVRRARGSYQHSNGRTYRSWSWAAFPVSGRGMFQFRTRTAATTALLEATEPVLAKET